MHGAGLLAENGIDAFPVGLGIFLFPCFHGVGADQKVVIHGVEDAAALGVHGVAGHLLDGGDGVHISPGFFIQNGIGAAAGMDGEKAVACHGGDILGEYTGRIDDQRRIEGAAVGGDAVNVAVLQLHAQHRGIEGDPGAVLHGIFGIGDGEPVGADAAGGRIGDGKGKVQVGLPAGKLLPGDQLGIADAVPVFADAAVHGDHRLEGGFFEADILPHPVKRHAQLPADRFHMFIAPADVVMLERPRGKVDAGMHLAVIAAAGLQCKVGFLFHQQDIQIPLGKLPRDGRPGNAPADDEDIGVLPLQGAIPQRGTAHGLLPYLIAADIIDHVDTAVLCGRHGAGLDDLRPCDQMTGQQDAVLIKPCRDRPAEVFFQPPVQLCDVHFAAPPVIVGQVADSNLMIPPGSGNVNIPQRILDGQTGHFMVSFCQ